MNEENPYLIISEENKGIIDVEDLRDFRKDRRNDTLKSLYFVLGFFTSVMLASLISLLKGIEIQNDELKITASAILVFSTLIALYLVRTSASRLLSVEENEYKMYLKAKKNILEKNN